MHVDIVKTEPTSISEYALARVALTNGHLEFDAEDRDYWRELLQRLVQIDPDERPDEFLAALEAGVSGTYFYATEPHDEARCSVPGAVGSPREVLHS
jgi:hypothetical protein